MMRLKLATCGGMYSTHTHVHTLTHNHMRRLAKCCVQLVGVHDLVHDIEDLRSTVGI